jgi:hypothetical protein
MILLDGVEGYRQVCIKPIASEVGCLGYFFLSYTRYDYTYTKLRAVRSLIVDRFIKFLVYRVHLVVASSSYNSVINASLCKCDARAMKT